MRADVGYLYSMDAAATQLDLDRRIAQLRSIGEMSRSRSVGRSTTSWRWCVATLMP